MTKFTVGKHYGARSACNYDTVFDFEVLGRSDKTITVLYQGKIGRGKAVAER